MSIWKLEKMQRADPYTNNLMTGKSLCLTLMKMIALLLNEYNKRQNYWTVHQQEYNNSVYIRVNRKFQNNMLGVYYNDLK